MKIFNIKITMQKSVMLAAIPAATADEAYELAADAGRRADHGHNPDVEMISIEDGSVFIYSIREKKKERKQA